MEGIDGRQVRTADDVVRVLDEGSNEQFQELRATALPSSVWLEVLERDPDHARNITLNRHLPVDVLLALSRHPDWQVRSDALLDRNFPEAELDRMARDPYSGVRAAVAHRPKLPPHLSEQLMADPSWWVRLTAFRSHPDWERGLAEQVYGADCREMRDILTLLPQVGAENLPTIEHDLDGYEVAQAVMATAYRVLESGQLPEPAVAERIARLAERLGVEDDDDVVELLARVEMADEGRTP